ncbi:hypothetical protein M3Y99_00999600 [Aphelenchoides fujianensis]|nr:hypothetical protein M3Y99_00999600 [Aphelenchoides fujianensis]
MGARMTAGRCRTSPTDCQPPSECSAKSADFSSLRSHFPLIRAHQIGNTATVLWILPPHFSQDLLGGRTIWSKACGLICCCVAEGLFRKGVLVPDLAARLPHSRGFGLHPLEGDSALCPPAVLSVLLEGIVEGNCAYELSGEPENITVPDALRATGRQMREVEWRPVDRTDLYGVLRVYLEAALHCPLLAAHSQLFFILGMPAHGILIVLQRTNGVISAFDSGRHQHNASHSIFRSTNKRVLSPALVYSLRRLQHFELSLIQFDGQLTAADCPLARPPPPPVLQATQRMVVGIVSTMKRFVHFRLTPDCRRRRAR